MPVSDLHPVNPGSQLGKAVGSAGTFKIWFPVPDQDHPGFGGGKNLKHGVGGGGSFAHMYYLPMVMGFKTKSFGVLEEIVPHKTPARTQGLDDCFLIFFEFAGQGFL